MADLTSVTNLLNTIVTPDLMDSTFLNREVFELPSGGPTPPPDGYPHRWPVLTVANASGGVANANGGPFPAAGQNTYQQATLTPGLYDSAFNVTMDLEAAVANGANAVDIIGAEFDKMVNRVYDNIAGNVLAVTAPFGIELAIDSTGTYANIAHTTVGWDSSENNLAGALTAVALYNMDETMTLPDRAIFQDFNIVSYEQIGNYLALTGAGTTTSIFRRQISPSEPQNANIGIDRRIAYFGNGVIMPVRDLTNTIWLMGERASLSCHYYDTPETPNASASVKGFKIHRPDPAGYGQTIVGSWFGIPLKVGNPFHWRKETGVTA